MEIKQYKYEKIETSSKEWVIPTTPKYFFETHIRRSIAVIPLWTTWNKEAFNKDEEIYALDIICVYQSFEAKIEKFNVNISQIESLYHQKGELSDLIKFIIDFDEEWLIRNEARFKADFENCLKSITNNLSK